MTKPNLSIVEKFGFLLGGGSLKHHFWRVYAEYSLFIKMEHRLLIIRFNTNLKVVNNTFLLCFRLVSTILLMKHEELFLLELYL